MNILADENIEAIVIKALRSEGHSIISIAEIAPGIKDREVLEKAREARCLLLTEDKDFGELVFRQKLLSTGVILLRFREVSSEEKIQTVLRIFATSSDKLNGHFTVISDSIVRIRPLT